MSINTTFARAHLTDSRIIGARKDKFDDAKEVGVAVGGILGAIVGAGVDATINRNKKSKQEMLSELTPYEILAYDARAVKQLLY